MSDKRKTAQQMKARKTTVPSNVKKATQTLKVRKATINSNGEKVARSKKDQKIYATIKCREGCINKEG
jgi:hypothetical protein